MVAATVVIPTFDHQDTIVPAIRSVQTQTVSDFEIIVVGDGAPDRTREIVRGLQSEDPRIRFFDNPKGEHFGQAHRHAALAAARSGIVCYLSDDDLWLPHHLAAMLGALADADFAHSIHVEIRDEDVLRAAPYDLADPQVVDHMVNRGMQNFGTSVVAHTLAAYRRLPRGWHVAEDRRAAALHMWQQWLSQPWCRARTLLDVTALHLPSATRRDWTIARRVAELERWRDDISRPDGVAALRGRLIAHLCQQYSRLVFEGAALYREYQQLQAAR